ncbi:phage holin family protein [Bacteroides heparinolyticus]|uniref:phage holin family protein n=1 Tax=Prevotella heparinolytica TaxID=28113 RepID=UPI0023F2351D|nr:phage holin family protein [Bacteroides heparinolyticus]MCI6211719.1 phage holin family protein [Bacteroides heparinolyticus]
MFADDQSFEKIQQLFVEFRKYLELQKEYTLLEITEKLSKLLSMLLLVILVIVLCVVVLFYLSFTLVYAIAPLVGGLTISYAIVAGFHILLILLVVLFRRKLIINPTVKFIAGLFLEKSNK